MSNNPLNIDHMSLSTTPIFLWKGKELVSQGTGFYYRHKNEKLSFTSLITNYHVLTGHRPLENKEDEGDSIAFHFHRSASNPGDIKVVRISLHSPNEKPIWMTNTKNPEADVAIIPLPTHLFQGCQVYTFSPEWTESKLVIRPATNVTLIGYPYGFYDKKNSLPIWKTGSVATEPEVDFDNKPLFLVDVSAFPGMSGSPVFGISHGTFETKQGTGVGNARKLLGIYSDMEMLESKKSLELIQQDTKLGITNLESLEIGYIWKSRMILDALKDLDFDQFLNERGMNKPQSNKV